VRGDTACQFDDRLEQQFEMLAADAWQALGRSTLGRRRCNAFSRPTDGRFVLLNQLAKIFAHGAHIGHDLIEPANWQLGLYCNVIEFGHRRIDLAAEVAQPVILTAEPVLLLRDPIQEGGGDRKDTDSQNQNGAGHDLHGQGAVGEQISGDTYRQQRKHGKANQRRNTLP